MSPKAQTQGQWIRIDERLDLIGSIKVFNHFANQSCNDECCLKWSIFSLHSALQSAMAFHLSIGDYLEVMRPKDKIKYLRADKENTEYPNCRMDSFLNLFKKIQSNKSLYTQFNPTNKQIWSIKKINNLRNQFTHFMPQFWSVEVSGIREIFRDCLDIIKFLGDNNKPRWWDEEQYHQFCDLLDQSYKKLVSTDEKNQEKV